MEHVADAPAAAAAGVTLAHRLVEAIGKRHAPLGEGFVPELVGLTSVIAPRLPVTETAPTIALGTLVLEVAAIAAMGFQTVHLFMDFIEHGNEVFVRDIVRDVLIGILVSDPRTATGIEILINDDNGLGRRFARIVGRHKGTGKLVAHTNLTEIIEKSLAIIPFHNKGHQARKNNDGYHHQQNESEIIHNQ